MTIRAQIAHEMPGRIRVRLPDFRGNAELFAQVEDMLLESRLFQSVRLNPVTASLVLEFSGPRENVLEALRARLPFELELAPVPAPAPARILSEASVRADQINPMFLVGTLFAAVGLVQAFRGKIMLPALSAFWYASSAFRLAGGLGVEQAVPDEAAAASE